jgi:hypothetical protein
MGRPWPSRFYAVRRGHSVAVSIMIAWHLVADLEMGITLGVLAWCSGLGKRLEAIFRGGSWLSAVDQGRQVSPSCST